MRNRLTMIWGVGAGLCVLLVLIQSSRDCFGDRIDEAWAWLLPAITPPIAMIITAIGYTAIDPVHSKHQVRKSFFWLALGVSIVYLILIIKILADSPPVSDEVPCMIDTMRRSNGWLAPVQGLVVSTLSVLFVTKQKQEGKER